MRKDKMKLLIYGAGVIGCEYGVLFSKAGYDVTIYARGKRLSSLRENGLRYKKKNQIHIANIKVIDRLEREDVYDFIFVAVRENQIHDVLQELKQNISPNIVTMVNTLEPYENWENICGEGRIIPAFPGAGGSFEGEVLNAALTPRLIQPTTFAEINGSRTERVQKLEELLKKSKIPYQIVGDMHIWQLCHLAMVVPIADAYYEAKCPEKAGLESKLMKKTAKQLKDNFNMLYKKGIVLLPKKMNLFRFVPVSIMKIVLGVIFQSNFGNVFMYQHSMKAPDEMRQLHQQFYSYIK